VSFFRDLPIRRKMTVAVLGTTTITLLATCATFVVYERMTFQRSMARNLTVLADVLARNSPAAISFDSQEEAREILSSLGADPSVTAACLYGTTGSRFVTYVRTGVAEFPERPGKEGARMENDYMVVERPVLLKDRQVGSIYLRADLKDLHSQISAYAGLSGLVLAGAFIFALALSSTLQRLILGPIIALTDTARKIGQTRDYSVRAKKMTGDELGILTDAFNQMLGDIEERTDAAQEANDSLKGANESLRVQAGEMRDAAAVLASSTSEIVAATRQLAGSATDAASAVSEATATVEEVRQASQLSSERARHVSSQAQTAVEVAKGGKLAVNTTIEGMNTIRGQMASIAQSILGLSAQSQAIGEIIASVDDLAVQSKLLAVNAAIEAAKAGEGGKGFSVVAQEVKLLAEQSKQATMKVRGILSDIQEATTSAVLTTEQGSKAVEAGVRQSSSAGESIGALAESIAGAAQAATQIAATSQQQFVGMDQVAAAMGNIKAASAQAVLSTRQTEAAAQQLQELGRKLTDLVERFKI
jgi:methyl-accepting chemotaxis protein